MSSSLTFSSNLVRLSLPANSSLDTIELPFRGTTFTSVCSEEGIDFLAAGNVVKCVSIQETACADEGGVANEEELKVVRSAVLMR